MMKITESEKNYIRKIFPSLDFKEKDGNIFLLGKFKFTARFVKKTKRYELLNPNKSYLPDRNLITDSYEIEINFSELLNPYREVKNTDERILDLAKKLGKPPSDLHVYFNPPEQKNKLCLVGYFDEDENIGLTQFMCEVVLPFFYDQSFYERYKKWPRGGFSHGCLGILENYNEKIKKCKNKEEKKELTKKCISLIKMLYTQKLDEKSCKHLVKYLQKKKVKHHWRCIGNRCYSQFIDCHSNAFLGARTLNKNMKKNSLNLYL